jgi:predicted permease
MRDLVLDLRVVWRQLLTKPLSSAVAVLTLALGLGVNTVAFTIVNGLLFKGPATAAREGVGRILTIPGGDEEGNASIAEFERFAAATRGAVDLAAEARVTMAWRHEGVATTVWALAITPNYFSTVTPQVLQGDIRVESRPHEMPTIVIGERFWRDALGARSLSGLSLQLNGIEMAVTGVMRESFNGPAGLYAPDVWVPLSAFDSANHSRFTRGDTRWLFLLGKMMPGITVAEVQSRVTRAAADMSREWPDTHRGRRAHFRLLSEANAELRGVAIAASLSMAVIGLVLLLACFNVTNLLLARAIDRERDMGIRTALGARPSRLFRLIVIEGLVLSVASGSLAMIVAAWTQSLAGAFAIPIDVPQRIDLSIDWRVLTFAGVLMVVAGFLPAVWPAISAARVNVSRVLGAQSATVVSGRPSGLRRWLVGVQMAGSTAFLSLAMLFIQSYSQLLDADLGFDREHLLVLDVDPVAHGQSPADAGRYAVQLLDAIRAVPGMRSAALVDRAPFFIGFDRPTKVWPSASGCSDEGCPEYPTYAVGPQYFDTLGVVLVGQGISGDAQGETIVVNDAFARERWANGNGLGQMLRVGPEGRPVTVAGIVGQTHTRGFGREAPALFVPFEAQHLAQGFSIVARSNVPSATLVRTVADAARVVNPDVPVVALKTMQQRMAVQLWPFRTLSALFTICGGLALILSVVGLAGVVVHSVSRRIREFGVRLSLGATSSDLLREVLGGGFRLLAPGMAAGVVLALAVSRLAQALFVGVDVLNPLTYLGVVLIESTVVLLACAGPARRAARVDPLVALRSH